MRGEAGRPNHTQGIVLEGHLRIARCSQDARLQIPDSVERIQQRAEVFAVESNRQCVDGEVTSKLVVFERPRVNGRLARLAAVALLSSSHEFQHLDPVPGRLIGVQPDRRRTEVRVNGNFPRAQLSTDGLGQANSRLGTDRNEIQIRRWPAEKHIADIATDYVGLHTNAVGDIRHQPQYRFERSGDRPDGRGLLVHNLHTPTCTLINLLQPSANGIDLA